MKKLKLIALIVFAGLPILAQEEVHLPPVVLAAGGSSDGSTTDFYRWRLSMVSVITLSEDFLIEDISLLQDDSEVDWKVILYPNPVESYFYIESDLPETREFILKLTDITGRTLMVQKATLTVKITIFAGALSGPIVWEGDHVVTTDKYGLFTLAIGEGTGGSTPPFSAIDWANDTYFLNVHVNDGGSWVDIRTTQFLSVPYALHAKTVESITETDPVYSASQAANITATDISNLTNLSGVNTGDQV